MLKRSELSSHKNTWKNLKYILVKEATLKRLYDFNYVTFLKKGKITDIGRRSVVARGWGEGRVNRQSPKEF